VSKKIKNQSFTFESLIRLSIFIAILYFGTVVISGQQLVSTDNSTKILGEMTKNIVSSPQYQTIYDKINPFVSQVFSYPEKYFKELQKQLIKKMSDSLIDSLE